MIQQAVDCYHTIKGEDGPWVLLLHGLFGSHNNLGGIARVLSAHYRVLMVDLRNHGRSPHSDFMSYDHMVSDVLALLNQLDIESTIVLGHSMGGKLAMGLASAHPERTDDPKRTGSSSSGALLHPGQQLARGPEPDQATCPRGSVQRIAPTPQDGPRPTGMQRHHCKTETGQTPSR